jgi:hypothetical protein
MKKQIVQIATELKLGDITTKQAKEELLSLFGVSGSLSCTRCEADKPLKTRFCLKCKSDDILPDHYTGDKCLNCGGRDLDYR